MRRGRPSADVHALREEYQARKKEEEEEREKYGQSNDADSEEDDWECTDVTAMMAERAVRTLALPHPESSTLSSVHVCSSLSMDLLWWLLYSQPARTVRAVMYGGGSVCAAQNHRLALGDNDVILSPVTPAPAEEEEAHAGGRGRRMRGQQSPKRMRTAAPYSGRNNNQAHPVQANEADSEDGRQSEAVSTRDTTMSHTDGREGAHHHRRRRPRPLRQDGSVTRGAAAHEADVMTSVFQALVHQLNGSYKAWHRELRNDVVLWAAGVLHYAGRAAGQTSNRSYRRRCARGTHIEQPVSSATMDAMSALALVVFDLVCGAETRDGAASWGKQNPHPSRRASMRPIETGTPAYHTRSHAGEQVDEYEDNEEDDDGGGVRALLTRHALRQYTLRFHGVTSPALRQHNLLFKRAGWQLLGAFCRWQAIQIRLAQAAAKGKGGANVSAEASAEAAWSTQPVGSTSSESQVFCRARLATTIDLFALGLVDVLLLYLYPIRGSDTSMNASKSRSDMKRISHGVSEHVEAMNVTTHLPSVAAWTQEERATLQREAWAVLMTLVETSAAETRCRNEVVADGVTSCATAPAPLHSTAAEEDGVTCIEMNNDDEDDVNALAYGEIREKVAPVVGAENFILQAGGLAVVLSHLPSLDGETVASAAAPQAMALLAALARVAAARGANSVGARLLGEVQGTLIPRLVRMLRDMSAAPSSSSSPPFALSELDASGRYHERDGLTRTRSAQKNGNRVVSVRGVADVPSKAKKTHQDEQHNGAAYCEAAQEDAMVVACLAVLKSLADVDSVAVVPLFARAGGAALMAEWFQRLGDRANALLVSNGSSRVRLEQMTALCDVTRALLLRSAEEAYKQAGGGGEMVADFVAAGGLSGLLQGVEALVMHWAAQRRSRSCCDSARWSEHTLRYALTVVADLLSCRPHGARGGDGKQGR